MSEMFSPPVEIDLQVNPGHVVFNHVEQARQWIDAEITAWQEYFPDNPASLGRFYAQFIADQRQALRRVQSEIAAAENAQGDDVAPEGIHAALQGFVKHKILHSESPIGKKAFQLMEAAESLYEKQQASGFLAAAITSDKAPISTFRNNHFQGDNFVPFISGVALYESFTGTGEDSAKFIDRAVQSCFAGWQQQLAIHQNDHFNAVHAIAKCKEEIGKEHERQKNEFNNQISTFNKDIEELKAFYHEKLRSEAPAEYWGKKARKHAWTGRATMALFFVLSAVFAYYAHELASILVDSITAATAASGPDAQESWVNAQGSFQLAFTRILVILVPGFFAVWLLRVLLKVGLSNLAIADDARHRVTLVGMFRSLTEHGAQVSEADRILMLNALFRPTPGTTDDDTGPPNWFEVMMEQLKSRSR